MNLYLISQEVNDDYDTFDSAVVIAESEFEAKQIHPSGIVRKNGSDSDWALPENVTAVYLGPYVGDLPEEDERVVCSSYNAG